MEQIDKLNFAEVLKNIIEKYYDVELVHLCESGSRAWGYNAQDSDYDMFFIYKDDHAKLLFGKSNVINVDASYIEQAKEQCNIKSTVEISVVGFEVSKAVKLACKPDLNMYCYLNQPNLLEVNAVECLLLQCKTGLLHNDFRSAYIKQCLGCITSYNRGTNKDFIRKIYMLQLVYQFNTNKNPSVCFSLPSLQGDYCYNEHLTDLIEPCMKNLVTIDINGLLQLTKQQRKCKLSKAYQKANTLINEFVNKARKVKLPRTCSCDITDMSYLYKVTCGR